MGQDRNFYEERLRKQAEITPFKATPKRVTVPKTFAEKARIDAEVVKRIDEFAAKNSIFPELSPADHAMTGDALALNSDHSNDVNASDAQVSTHPNVKWRRARLMALVIVALVMWLHPDSSIRLFVCAVFLSLVAVIATGSERVRDEGVSLSQSSSRYRKT